MKDINSITTINPQRQKEINRWITVSVSILVLIGLSLAGITLAMIYKQQHYARLHTQLTKHQKNDPASLMTNRQKEIEQLNKQRALIQHYKSNPSQIAAIITTLTQTVPQETTIESIQIDSTHKTYSLTIQTANVKQAVHCVGLLENTDAFEHTMLTSLHTSNNQTITAQLHGSLAHLK